MQSFIKRLFDICFSLIVLILFAPFFLLIAIGICLSSKGAIFFTQQRLGQEGKPFNCYKFRTMHLDAERQLEILLASNSALQAEWNQNQKLKDDPRIFPFGKFLRKFSLDEFPQFWNVLKGDLSVVGPRPYMVNQRTELGLFEEKILSVRPGLTGIWQTSGRSRRTFQERIALDAAYVERATMRFDLLLILKTLPCLLFPRDAY